MYKHQRIKPKKWFFSYIIPFLILGIIIFWCINLLKQFNINLFKNFNINTFAVLEVKQDTVKVLLKGNDQWQSIPNKNVNLKLFAGDKIKTILNGEAKIKLVKDSFVYLQTGTNLSIDEHKVKLHLDEGEIIVSVERIINPKSEFIITIWNNLEISSRKGSFILNQNSIKVLDGKVKLKQKSNKTTINETSVWIGQKLTFILNDFEDFEDIQLLESDIYENEKLKLILTNLDQIKELKITETIDSTNNEEVIPEEEIEVSEDKLLTEEPVEKLEKHEITITSHEDNQVIKNDFLELKWTTSIWAESVSINDYVLSKFNKWDTDWVYRAKTNWGNLKQWSNEFKIQVKFSDNVEISKTITITLEEKEKVEEVVKTETSSENETMETTSTDLSIISPIEGSNIDSKSITIKGIAPINTSKIIIGNYTLRTFNKGDTQFKYVADKKYGNLEYGKENKYLITALDEDDKEIASITFSFFSTAEE